MTTTPVSRILVVDDDPVISDLVIESLQLAGYHTARAASADEAVGLLEQLHVDLILTDALVDTGPNPDGDRWASLERLRGSAGKASVIIFTAHRRDDFAGYRERGFSGLLLKPFDLDDLLDLVGRHLPARVRLSTDGGTAA